MKNRYDHDAVLLHDTTNQARLIMQDVAIVEPQNEYEVINEFLPCVCGCLEHHAYIELTYWKKDSVVIDADLILSIHLAPQSFWTRLKNAFKYVFQLCKKNGEYDEVVFNKSRAEKMKILLDKYIANIG